MGTKRVGLARVQTLIQNLKRELQGYVWARDKEGNQIQKPCGEHPDCIDAMRYVFTDTQQTNRGEYHIW